MFQVDLRFSFVHVCINGWLGGRDAPISTEADRLFLWLTFPMGLLSCETLKLPVARVPHYHPPVIIYPPLGVCPGFWTCPINGRPDYSQILLDSGHIPPEVIQVFDGSLTTSKPYCLHRLWREPVSLELEDFGHYFRPQNGLDFPVSLINLSSTLILTPFTRSSINPKP